MIIKINIKLPFISILKTKFRKVLGKKYYEILLSFYKGNQIVNARKNKIFERELIEKYLNKKSTIKKIEDNFLLE